MPRKHRYTPNPPQLTSLYRDAVTLSNQRVTSFDPGVTMLGPRCDGELNSCPKKVGKQNKIAKG